MKKTETGWETKATGPLELAFLFARVFGGLGLPLSGFLRGLQEDLSRPDPVAGSSPAAFTGPGGRASRSEAAGRNAVARTLPVGRVVGYLRLRLLRMKWEIITDADIQNRFERTSSSLNISWTLQTGLHFNPDQFKTQ